MSGVAKSTEAVGEKQFNRNDAGCYRATNSAWKVQCLLTVDGGTRIVEGACHTKRDARVTKTLQRASTWQTRDNVCPTAQYIDCASW